jgi:ribosomal 30S subunit maturation factor RimM
MSEHQIRVHGPSGEIEVELQGDSPQACLDQLQAWMRRGTQVEVQTRRGTARINMGDVWAVEYIPSGRMIAR